MSYNIGDWSSGMIGVSKTFGGSSILSSPVDRRVRNLEFPRLLAFFHFLDNSNVVKYVVKQELFLK